MIRLTPFTIQLIITASSQLAALSVGGSISYPTVLIQQFKSNESTIHPDLDTVTWIASMHGFSGIPSILMPTLMQWKGRKFAFVLSCLFLSVGLILTATAATAETLIFTESISGLGTNCINIVNLMTISEMIAPKYRPLAITSASLITIIGMSVGSFIGQFVHWKTLALIVSAPVTSALLLVSFWPESPSWLAYKGRFEECKKALICLRGTNDNSMKELNALIAAQKENIKGNNKQQNYRKLLLNLKGKDFYIPNLLTVVIVLTYYVAGGLSWYMYAFDTMLQVTGDMKSASMGIIMIQITFIIMPFVALLLVRYFSTKSVVLSSGSACLVFHLCSAIIVYLQKEDVIAKDSLLFMFSFIGYFVSCCSGFNLVTYALASELMPVKHRAIGGGLFIVYTSILHAIIIKTLPFLNLYTNLWGTFLLCVGFGSVGLYLMWKYIPNTKNRTLQEIEDYYNYGTFFKERSIQEMDVKEPIILSG